MARRERQVSDPIVTAPTLVWCGDELPPEADAEELLGQKGQRLLAMYRAGLPVPPFFIITTAAAEHPIRSIGLEPEVQVDIHRALEKLERATGREFGDERDPLLLAVRCSARDVPAGLLPSVQNLGLNPRIAQTLLARTADDRFVHDCYRRLILQFARLVHDVDAIHFERDLRAELDNRGLRQESELDGPAMRELARRFQGIFSIRAGQEFPNEPLAQFRKAIDAALRLGELPRIAAVTRRAGRQGPLPVAVIVQAMVFGNRDRESFSGVASSRDPRSGEGKLQGEYLPISQGLDIVGGRLHPAPLEGLREQSLQSYDALAKLARELEQRLGDAQEFEFTVELGKVYLLQSRPAGRSPEAAVRIAVDLAREGLITRPQAVMRIKPEALEQILHSRFDLSRRPKVVARGFAASPGAAVGSLAFTSAEAMERAARGEHVILVRRETDATDVIGMQQCEGILTSTGGMTSHAAVVARGMGKPCVAGAGDIQIDEQRRRLSVGRYRLGPGEKISIDGSGGEVYVGAVPRVRGDLPASLGQLLGWADELRELRVYANADTPEDAAMAETMGAEGIGLCRTEHMFFAPRRITLMRKLILAGRDDLATRRTALEALLSYQREDFIAIFSRMAGKRVIVRLLDPPLHEFLPHGAEDQKELARELNLTQREVRSRIEQLHETNPMLGHRGCRLAVSYPEIAQMQTRAVMEAAAACLKQGQAVSPWIMIPLTISPREMEAMRELVRTAAEVAMREVGILVQYEVGTMIETPRAALLAGEMARHADFFSFGTNDLTQAALAISRDDAGKFMDDYQRQGLLECDPFRTIDQAGVGELIAMAIQRGRAVRPGLSCGICGEHAGDPASIAFFAGSGADYISCSPKRLPIARLAAAQAALEKGSGK